MISSKTNRKAKACFLVDDDDDDKEVFSLALRKIDPSIECMTASDGLEALSILRKKTFVPDYIFLDLNMPQMNGKECLTELRKHAHLDDVPIIIYSTSSHEKDKEETKSLGANRFITKPPLVSTLVEMLEALFRDPTVTTGGNDGSARG